MSPNQHSTFHLRRPVTVKFTGPKSLGLFYLGHLDVLNIEQAFLLGDKKPHESVRAKFN